MIIPDEFRKRYTSVERYLLAISSVSVLIAAVMISSMTIFSFVLMFCAMLVIMVIVGSRSRFEQKSEAHFGIAFDSFGGLSIDGMVVSEFAYLLRYVTAGRVGSFQDFQLIHDHCDEILAAIELERARAVLKEQEAFGVSRETADANLLNLSRIVSAISGYQAAMSRPGSTSATTAD